MVGGSVHSFIGSLFAKVHAAPPSIGNLARLFQEFYSTASSAIQTHLSALATRASRDASPSRSRSLTASRLRAKAASLGTRDRPNLLAMIGSRSTTPASSSLASRPADAVAQQLLTPDELAARKRSRKALEAKRLVLEEAVERRLCENLYSRIYRHRSTQDEAEDEKLRSKTAALALVGIGLEDLGICLSGGGGGTGSAGGGGGDYSEEAAKKTEQEEVGPWLQVAREYLVRMHEKRYPHGKLNMLKAAHKSIVETLSRFHPSASADEVMPMLIYTLITMPPESLHVISDARFMQRFRWEAKLTGEAAYCLTNLEAAIGFLETVDLSTLREDEHPSGPAKAKAGWVTDSTKMMDATFPPAYSGVLIAIPPAIAADSTSTAAAATASASSPVPNKPASGTTATALTLKVAAAAQNRRLGDLVNMPAQAVNAASGVMLNTADQGLKTITTSLDASYKFLFGRLVERNNHKTAATAGAAITTTTTTTNTIIPSAIDGEEAEATQTPNMMVPKTLDDARKLVSTPPPPVYDDDDDEPPLIHPDLSDSEIRRPTAATREERKPSLISGWRTPTRDHSADSSRSGRTSLKKAPISEDRDTSTTTSATATTSPAMLDSVRSLGSSLNPMSRLSGISMIRGFARGPTPAVAAATATTPPQRPTPPLAAPVPRFMQVADAGGLKLAEVAELLADYRRLAGALQGMGAFER